MGRMCYRWKAIGQVMPRRALALIPCKHKPRAVLQFVYRSGRHALEDWSLKLRDALQISEHDDVVERISFEGRLEVDS